MARDGFQLPDDAVPGRETCRSRSCTHSHDQVVTRSMMIMMMMMRMRITTESDMKNMITRHIEQTVAYTRERKAFGAPLLHNQYIHFRLAELLTEVTVVHMLCAKLEKIFIFHRFCNFCDEFAPQVEMLRSLLYRATDLFVAGQ